MPYKIDEIEGIGPAYREKLAAVGISNTDDLLKTCATANGRKEIAAKSGLSVKQILGWTNLADLMRVSGVGKQFAELLEASGVDTIKELRTRNALSLSTKMEEVNSVKHLTHATPTVKTITDWIAQAKLTDPKISY